MAITKPTVAVDFGDGKPPKKLRLEKLYELMKQDANSESSESSGSEQEDDNSDSESGSASEVDSELEQDKRKPKPMRPFIKTKPKTTNVPVGSVSEVKNIYKSSRDRDGNWTWVDKYPADTPEPAENAITDTYAVLVRNVKSQDGRKKLEAHSIVIQSPWLKKALGNVILKDYPGIACELKRLTFEAPFKPFVHRWADLVEYMGRQDLDETTRAHIKILHDVLKYEIGEQIKAYEDYVLNGVITFEHLW